MSIYQVTCTAPSQDRWDVGGTEPIHGVVPDGSDETLIVHDLPSLGRLISSRHGDGFIYQSDTEHTCRETMSHEIADVYHLTRILGGRWSKLETKVRIIKNTSDDRTDVWNLIKDFIDALGDSRVSAEEKGRAKGLTITFDAPVSMSIYKISFILYMLRHREIMNMLVAYQKSYPRANMYKAISVYLFKNYNNFQSASNNPFWLSMYAWYLSSTTNPGDLYNMANGPVTFMASHATHHYLTQYMAFLATNGITKADVDNALRGFNYNIRNMLVEAYKQYALPEGSPMNDIIQEIGLALKTQADMAKQASESLEEMVASLEPEDVPWDDTQEDVVIQETIIGAENEETTETIQ